MVSVRSLLLVWMSSSLATLAYAYADLRLTPGLRDERGFSVHIDFERIGELWHWGGRLLNGGAIGLLVLNSILVGGIVALLLLWVWQLVRRARSRHRPAPPEQAPVSTTFGSLPPPAN